VPELLEPRLPLGVAAVLEEPLESPPELLLPPDPLLLEEVPL